VCGGARGIGLAGRPILRHQHETPGALAAHRQFCPSRTHVHIYRRA
jgi:hypothetical protein